MYSGGRFVPALDVKRGNQWIHTLASRGRSSRAARSRTSTRRSGDSMWHRRGNGSDGRLRSGATHAPVRGPDQLTTPNGRRGRRSTTPGNLPRDDRPNLVAAAAVQLLCRLVDEIEGRTITSRQAQLFAYTTASRSGWVAAITRWNSASCLRSPDGTRPAAYVQARASARRRPRRLRAAACQRTRRGSSRSAGSTDAQHPLDPLRQPQVLCWSRFGW
jgi:hypothetical protein